MIKVKLLVEESSQVLTLKPTDAVSHASLQGIGEAISKGARPEFLYNAETRELSLVMPA